MGNEQGKTKSPPQNKPAPVPPVQPPQMQNFNPLMSQNFNNNNCNDDLDDMDMNNNCNDFDDDDMDMNNNCYDDDEEGQGPDLPHQEWGRVEDMLKNITAPTDDKGQPLEIDLDKCLELNLKLGSDKIKALNQEQMIPFLLNIKETNFDELEIEIDSKIDLVCVIDISGSMSGPKLDHVKLTMLALLDVLGSGHRLSIVLFDDYARDIMNFKLLNEENKPKIREIINAIYDKGSTNITAGVHNAQKMIGRRETKNHVSCIFLLSDGEHNKGSISMDILYNNDLERTKCEYTLTSFGYGDDHDANLLQEMSEKKGGNYYFVNDIKKIEECFLDCLGMVTSVLGQNILATLELKPTPLFPEIRFHKTFGPYWKSISPIKNTLKINSFYSGFNKNFIAQLALNAVKNPITEEMEIIIGQLKFEIDPVDNLERKVYHQDIKLKILPASSSELIEENEEVQKQFSRVKGADVIEIADELNKAQKYDEAVKLIEVFEKDLDTKGFKNDALFKEMGISMKKQKEMIRNTAQGVKNEFKSVNYAKQNKNIFMNECSAPMFSKGLYQNKKQKKMSRKAKHSGS